MARTILYYWPGASQSLPKQSNNTFDTDHIEHSIRLNLTLRAMLLWIPEMLKIPPAAQLLLQEVPLPQVLLYYYYYCCYHHSQVLPNDAWWCWVVVVVSVKLPTKSTMMMMSVVVSKETRPSFWMLRSQ
jgi:hypothetical protein